MTVNSELADRLAKKLIDNRSKSGWEEELWDELQWLDLDAKQIDILFDMIVARWDRARR